MVSGRAPRSASRVYPASTAVNDTDIDQAEADERLASLCLAHRILDREAGPAPDASCSITRPFAGAEPQFLPSPTHQLRKKPEVERAEHQNDADVGCKPLPKPSLASEEQEVRAHHDDDHA